MSSVEHTFSGITEIHGWIPREKLFLKIGLKKPLRAYIFFTFFESRNNNPSRDAQFMSRLSRPKISMSRISRPNFGMFRLSRPNSLCFHFFDHIMSFDATKKCSILFDPVKICFAILDYLDLHFLKLCLFDPA